MRLLRDLGSFMRVRRMPFFRTPAAVEHTDGALDEDASLAQLVSQGSSKSTTNNGDAGADDVIVETKPAREDPVRLVRTIGERLERHEGRSERIAGSLDQVPDLAQVTMQALPELTRNTTALLDAWESHATDEREQRRVLANALTRIESVAAGHGETLGLVQKQLVESEHAMHRVSETLEEMRSTLRDLAGAHDSTAQLVRDTTLRQETREQAMESALRRCDRWMVVLAAMTALASLGAMAAAML